MRHFCQHISTCFRFIPQSNFWEIVTSIGTIGAVIVALVPLWQKWKLGRALFEDAVQVNVFPDGVLTLFNIFDEPVVVTKISQCLIEGKKDLNLSINEKSEKILKMLSRLPNKQMEENLVNRVIAPRLSFVYAGSKTHLPRGMETESVWVVKTTINYESRNGQEKRIKKFTFRFSKTLEPRLRWVELLI